MLSIVHFCSVELVINWWQLSICTLKGIYYLLLLSEVDFFSFKNIYINNKIWPLPSPCRSINSITVSRTHFLCLPSFEYYFPGTLSKRTIKRYRRRIPSSHHSSRGNAKRVNGLLKERYYTLYYIALLRHVTNCVGNMSHVVRKEVHCNSDGVNLTLIKF